MLFNSHQQVERFSHERGLVTIYLMLFLGLLLGSLGIYQRATSGELSHFRSSKRMKEAFYASEAALNLRIRDMQQGLEDQIIPSGTPPSGSNPCLDGDQGSGDMKCSEFTFASTKALSYVIPDTAEAKWIQIPAGEAFAGLSAKERMFGLRALAIDNNGFASTRTSMELKVRFVPLFQFGTIFDHDMEFYPGPTMSFNGPVHTNKSLYVASQTDLYFNGQVTSGGDIFTGSKWDTGYAWRGKVWARNGTGLEVLAGSGSLQLLNPEDLVDAFSGSVLSQTGKVNFPKISEFDPQPGSLFWSTAHLRLALRLNSTTNAFEAIEVYNKDGTVNSAGTTALNTICAPGTVGYTQDKFLDRREGAFLTLLEVDFRQLLDCLHNNASSLMGGKGLDDASGGGLGLFLTIIGPNSSANSSRYGVRISNAETLEANMVSAPKPIGITLITDHALITKGNFNSPPGNDDARIPAALMGDAIHILSSAWNDASSGTPTTGDACPSADAGCRSAVDTRVNAAMLAGFVPSGGSDGSASQNLTPESGGVHNFMRFHEDWSGRTFTYRGSIASIAYPRRSTGEFRCCGYTYRPPRRDWFYEERFLETGSLPPMTPFFTYAKQEFFDREYR